MSKEQILHISNIAQNECDRLYPESTECQAAFWHGVEIVVDLLKESPLVKNSRDFERVNTNIKSQYD